jgi:hypothetical protein
MKRLILLPLLFSLSACATFSGQTDTPQITAGKSLLAIQTTIVSTRTAIGVPCQKGLIAPADCTSMDLIYQQSKPAYDAAVDAATIALTSGTATDAATFQTKQDALLDLQTQILGLAAKYGIKGGN